MKQPRYYEIVDNVLYVYEQPYKHLSQSVSIVSVDQIAYYRKQFKLSKLWSE